MLEFFWHGFDTYKESKNMLTQNLFSLKDKNLVKDSTRNIISFEQNFFSNSTQILILKIDDEFILKTVDPNFE